MDWSGVLQVCSAVTRLHHSSWRRQKPFCLLRNSATRSRRWSSSSKTSEMFTSACARLVHKMRCILFLYVCVYVSPFVLHLCAIMHPNALSCPKRLFHKVSLLFFSKQNNSSLSNDRSRQSKLANLTPQALKHLWIRTALMEKLLDKIVLYLVENSGYFYVSFNAIIS